MPSARPVPVPTLTQEEIDELGTDEKRLEAWHMSVVLGHSQVAIGKVLGVGPTTVGRWLDVVGAERRSRAENIERETERIIGTLEAALVDSYDAFRDSRAHSPTTMAAPSHMKNVMEAAKEIARLRGIEPTRKSSGGIHATEVIVNIGGIAPGSTPISVTTRELSAPIDVELVA